MPATSADVSWLVIRCLEAGILASLRERPELCRLPLIMWWASVNARFAEARLLACVLL
jgi:hypothetical protein